MHSLHHYQHLHQVVPLLQLMNLHGQTIITPSLYFTLGFTLRVCCTFCVWTNVYTIILSYRVASLS